MDLLIKMNCIPVEDVTEPLEREKMDRYLPQLQDWSLQENNTKLVREFGFKDFKTALDFVNQVGEVADDEGHHPNIYLHSWNKVRITLFTPRVKGLSQNDFIIAAKIDAVSVQS